MCIYIFFFFFKQKTAYEIYQCDWSSDVCSSDLKTNFSHFLGEIIQNHARRADNKGIKIELKLPSEPVIFEFDQFQIERVCNNLLDNAIKFTQKGGTINIEVTENDSRVITRVSDNGTGIDEKELRSEEHTSELQSH